MTQNQKNDRLVRRARTLIVGGALVTVVITIGLFALSDDVLAQVVGNAGAARPLAYAGIMLFIFLVVGLFIGWTNPYTAPTLPDYKTMKAKTKQVEGAGLKADKVLEEEFEYAGKTAEQAMEHRMTIVNFYLLIVGGAGSGVVALVSANRNVAIAAVPLLWLIATIGGLITLQLIALRRAWAGSVLEMNYVREFFVANNSLFEGDELVKAFSWKPTTIPETHKRGTVFYYSVLLIAVLDAAAFFGGIFVLGLNEQVSLITQGGLVIAGIFALIFLALHMWVYDAMLIPIIKPQPSRTSAPAVVASVPEGVHVQPTSYTPPPTSAGANTVTGSREVYHGKILTLRVDDIRQPNGHVAQREVVEVAPAVVIIPYLAEDNAFLFIEQYRDAVGKTLIELPAGKVQDGEDHAAAAHRELLEETGYEAGEMRYLGSYYTSPGFTNEEHHLYLATQLRQVSGIQDTDEVHALHRIPRDEAVSLTIKQAFTDAKTLVGVLWGDRELPTHV